MALESDYAGRVRSYVFKVSLSEITLPLFSSTMLHCMVVYQCVLPLYRKHISDWSMVWSSVTSVPAGEQGADQCRTSPNQHKLELKYWSMLVFSDITQ